jgi:zinc and cadmium transporter
MANYGHVILFSLLGGVFSLAGGIILLSGKHASLMLATYATPFAAGALLAAAFFDLMPASFELTAQGAASRWVLAGIVLFFLLEHFLHWFHHHDLKEHEHAKSAAPLIIISDTIHNFIDGVAIGAALLISVPTGIVTALAVAAHEIPQEIGDFGLLLKAGFRRRHVLLANFLSAIATLVGGLLTFWLGTKAGLPLGELLALTAGLFIYIAASDLIPAIHERAKERFATLAAVLLILGILVVGGVTEIAHEYIDTEHSPGTNDSLKHDNSESDEH